jgi:hypothetical protein
VCYSAQVQADYKKYVVMFGATMSIRDFYEIFYRRGLDPKIKIPKAVEANFGDPQSDDERAIKALIDEFNDKQAAKFEEELVKQRKRVADAERILQTKPTKKAQDDQRIATDKVKQLMGQHADLKHTELRDRDGSIFPGWYVPVMIWEDAYLHCLSVGIGEQNSKWHDERHLFPYMFPYLRCAAVGRQEPS